MKKLLPLILLCLLLCGCGRTSLSEETIPTVPTESVAGEVPGPEEYGGTVQTVPLNLRKVRGLRVFGGDLLLFSGQGSTALTLLEGETLEECAAVTLDFQLEQDDPSLMLHPDGTLSFFDPVAEETVVLDSTLQQVRRISAPGALSGVPVLSEDGRTLFYCTASHLRAWDLDSGIRRCVKEMAFERQHLTGVHWDDTVLQCRVTEGTEERTLFLSAQDGRLLHESPGEIDLRTDNGCYYAFLPAGTYRALAFGTDPETPRMLAPAVLSAEAFFLPGQQAAVTAALLRDDRVQLDYYDLLTGSRTFRVTLGRYQLPRAVEAADGDTLILLAYDPAQDRELLILWELQRDSSIQEEAGYVLDYRTADASDTAGLARCRRQAVRLEQKYGINILLGEEAAAVEPWDYAFTPEHLVPILEHELELLEQRLTYYPEEILQDTAAHFSSLNLCIVRSLSGTAGGPESATGVQFLVGPDAYVVIAAGTFAEQALYHELFHLMEIHIFAESRAFDRWDELNPAGFQYDYDYAANALRDSGVYLFEENRAFVDTYSMSYPKEDRARIMEYAMLPGQESLFRPRQMQAKLRQLCTGIREAYDLKDQEGEFRWEQYLE